MVTGDLMKQASIAGLKNDELEVPVIPAREKLSYHQAARYGDKLTIKQYLQKFRRRKKKINKFDRHEFTALHYAVRHGHLEIIKLLLEGGADVNIVGSDGAQPIHIAAKYFKSSKHISDNADVATSNVIAQIFEDLDNPAAKLIGDSDADIDMERPETGEDVSDVITYLLRYGADVNAIDNYNQTPLHYAAGKGNLEAIVLLLSWPGIDLEITDTAGGTALHTACGNGQKDAVKLLLTSGSRLMVWDNEHKNPFHQAATSSEGEAIVQELINWVEQCGGELEHWKLVDMVNDQDNQGQSILHLAIDLGHYEISQLAIEKGAKVNQYKNGFATPLHLAAATGNPEVAKLLIAHGADIEAQNVLLETPLHKAAKYNRLKVMQYLLERGCKVDSYDQDNRTPLIVAAANGSKGAFETVKLLLRYKADISNVDSYEKSAIFWAAEENSIAVLKLLLSSIGNDPNTRALIGQTDRFDNTPLHIAAKKGYKHIVQLLIEYEANVQSRNDEELTPLHLAATNGNEKVARALLKKEPDIINDEDESGNTALHLAALNDYPKLIDLLIDSGAGVDPRNIVLWTPLDCAAAKGYIDCVTRLLAHGSPVDPMDLSKSTPLHLASKEGYDDVVKVLLDNGADLTLLDHAGKNALDMAVENSHREVALTILNHKEWLSAAKNRSREGKGITTPMRQMIKKLPDVAYELLNKCMKFPTNIAKDSEDFNVKFFYDLIDDTYADWSNDYDEADMISVVTTNSLPQDPEEDMNRLTDPIREIMERKETHPLMLMCDYKCDKLLHHPIVLSLIYDKWQKFGRIIFYSKFFLYFLFLFFLTGFLLVATPLLPRAIYVNGSSICIPKATQQDKEKLTVITFYMVGRIILLVLGSLQLFFELLQLISRRMDYITDVDNWIELTIYILTLVYVWPHFDRLITGNLGIFHCTAQISVGAATIFLAWINLLLFIQKFPTVGIYVVMFIDVMKTFLKFSMTFILFVVAFALGFYTLLEDMFEMTYKNIGRTIFKTTVMMIGELDFDDLFNNGDRQPPLITWFLFGIFIIVMTILLMNLLVGLAVDDIKAVLDQAVMSRIAMQVDLVINVEKSLPQSFRMKFIPKDKTLYPNREFKWYSATLKSHITRMDEIEEAIKPTKTVSEIVQEKTESIRETVENLKGGSKVMGKKISNIENMIDRLLKYTNVPDDTDDYK